MGKGKGMRGGRKGDEKLLVWGICEEVENESRRWEVGRGRECEGKREVWRDGKLG